MASVRLASEAIGDITNLPSGPCSPCQTKYGTTSRLAGWYCIDCEEFICNDCKVSHESLSQHKIVTHTQGTERKEMFRELAEMETCNVHKERKLEFFCPSHKTFCCSVCIADEHRRCRPAPEILERSRDKILGPSPNLLKAFQVLQRKMEDIQNHFDSNRKNLEKLRSDLPDVFKSLRKDVSDLIDRSEQKLRQELEEKIKDEEKKVSDFKTKLYSSEKYVHNSVNLLEGLKDRGTEAQKIISEYEMKVRCKQYEDQITAVEGFAARLEMKVRLQPNFVKLLQTQENIFNVSIQGTQMSVSTSAKRFRSRNAKFLSKVPCKTEEDMKKPWISGVTFLAVDRLLLVDNRNKKVKLYNRDLTYDSELLLDDVPYDVTTYDKDKVAITLLNKKEIRLLSVKQKISPLQTISLPYKSHSLMSISKLSNDRFMVTALPDIVGIVDIHGKGISRLKLDNPTNIAVNGTNTIAYVSSYWSHNVCAFDVTSNKLLFTYQHDDLKSPRGVTVDKDGNVYVCGWSSHNVHQISAEGKLIQILLSQNDNLKHPAAVCFSNDGQRLLVTDEADDEAELVKIYGME